MIMSGMRNALSRANVVDDAWRDSRRYRRNHTTKPNTLVEKNSDELES